MNDQLRNENYSAHNQIVVTSSKSVLLAESNLIVARQIATLVTQLKHRSLGSTCCINEIEEQIDSKNPDYIFINMATCGEFDSYQIAKILKLDYEIPYALIVKDNVSEERKWAEELNPDGLIFYSTNEDQLRNQIEVILS